MTTVPLVGRREPAPSWLFSIASPKVRPTPITSPVDAHLGAQDRVDAGELVEREHRFLDAEVRRDDLGQRLPVGALCVASDCPAMQRAAILASGWPVALLTYGTVRDARGLTSST